MTSIASVIKTSNRDNRLYYKYVDITLLQSHKTIEMIIRDKPTSGTPLTSEYIKIINEIDSNIERTVTERKTTFIQDCLLRLRVKYDRLYAGISVNCRNIKWQYAVQMSYIKNKLKEVLC